MRALFSLVMLLGGCDREGGWIRRPNTAPRAFCAALATSDFETATWAVATKLDSVGGIGNEAASNLVRAWLYTQPCIVSLDDLPCIPSMHPEINGEATIGNTVERIRVRLYLAGGATVAPDEDCRLGRSVQVRRFNFDDVVITGTLHRPTPK